MTPSICFPVPIPFPGSHGHGNPTLRTRSAEVLLDLQDLEFRQLVERLKLRSPIEVIVGERVSDLKQAGAILKARCPFHEERTPSFTVDPRRGTWRCWGACGEGGDAISFIERFDGVDFQDALRILAQGCGEELPEKLFQSGGHAGGGPARAERDRRFDILARAVKLYQGFLGEAAMQGSGTGGPAAVDYLLERGLTRATQERFQIGWAPREGSPLLAAATNSGVPLELLVETGLVRRADDGRAYDFFRGRVMIPILDRLGRPVGFGARILPADADDAESKGRPQAKYVNTPDTALFHKGRLIYGLDAATQAVRRSRHLILVEGYTDVMAAHQCGHTHVAAVLGTSTTEDHAALVRRTGARRVTLVFDGDAAGQKASRRALLGLLPVGLELYVATLPAGQDPCDLILSSTEEEGTAPFDRLCEGALSWFDWSLQELRGRSGAELASGVDEFFELLARLDKPVERAARVAELSKGLELPHDAVRGQWLAFENRARPSQRNRASAAAAVPSREAGDDSGDVPMDPQELQAYESLLGAMLLDNSLISFHRELAASCPPGDQARIFEELFALYDNDEDDESIDADRLMNALVGDPVRRSIVRIEQAAGFAESPETLARDQEAWFSRRSHERLIDSLGGARDSLVPGNASSAGNLLSSGDSPEEIAVLKNLHEELRRWRVPSPTGSSGTP